MNQQLVSYCIYTRQPILFKKMTNLLMKALCTLNTRRVFNNVFKILNNKLNGNLQAQNESTPLYFLMLITFKELSLLKIA